MKHYDIIRRFGYRGDRMPPIATESGTRFRTKTLDEHCGSVYHKECVKAEKIRVLKKPSATLMPMDLLLAKNQETSASRAAKLLIQVSKLCLNPMEWEGEYESIY